MSWSIHWSSSSSGSALQSFGCFPCPLLTIKSFMCSAGWEGSLWEVCASWSPLQSSGLDASSGLSGWQMFRILFKSILDSWNSAWSTLSSVLCQSHFHSHCPCLLCKYGQTFSYDSCLNCCCMNPTLGSLRQWLAHSHPYLPQCTGLCSSSGLSLKWHHTLEPLTLPSPPWGSYV